MCGLVYLVGFYIGSGNLNSGPYEFRAGVSCAEPSPCSKNSIFKRNSLPHKACLTQAGAFPHAKRILEGKDKMSSPGGGAGEPHECAQMEEA